MVFSERQLQIARTQIDKVKLLLSESKNTMSDQALVIFKLRVEDTLNKTNIAESPELLVEISKVLDEIDEELEKRNSQEF